MKINTKNDEIRKTIKTTDVVETMEETKPKHKTKIEEFQTVESPDKLDAKLDIKRANSLVNR